MQMIVTFVWTDGCHNHQQNHFVAATFLFAQNILVVITVSTQFEVFAIVSRLNPHHSSVCYNMYVFVFMYMYILWAAEKHLSFQHTCSKSISFAKNMHIAFARDVSWQQIQHEPSSQKQICLFNICYYIGYTLTTSFIFLIPTFIFCALLHLCALYAVQIFGEYK